MSDEQRKRIEEAAGKTFTVFGYDEGRPTGVFRLSYIVDFAIEQVNAAREEDAAACEREAERLATVPDNGYIEPDTNAFVWTNREAEWSAISLCEAGEKIRALKIEEKS